ncbi:hypothetical protein CVT24_009530 [Panaeolus cyanescens]|uniref:Uncharacterized protein n=1 Tax=Panaeolus cyanescens TaxID=181874 RepID=A0A409VYB4_9AGAR|nr:hypothetical protein CVT24_009530 [Panaeolus cyanescens]
MDPNINNISGVETEDNHSFTDNTVSNTNDNSLNNDNLSNSNDDYNDNKENLNDPSMKPSNTQNASHTQLPLQTISNTQSANNDLTQHGSKPQFSYANHINQVNQFNAYMKQVGKFHNHPWPLQRPLGTQRQPYGFNHGGKIGPNMNYIRQQQRQLQTSGRQGIVGGQQNPKERGPNKASQDAGSFFDPINVESEPCTLNPENSSSASIISKPQKHSTFNQYLTNPPTEKRKQRSRLGQAHAPIKPEFPGQCLLPDCPLNIPGAFSEEHRKELIKEMENVSAFHKHLRKAHKISGSKGSSEPAICKWPGCEVEMKLGGLLRHIVSLHGPGRAKADAQQEATLRRLDAAWKKRLESMSEVDAAAPEVEKQEDIVGGDMDMGQDDASHAEEAGSPSSLWG